jgi:glycosyltransferase involved in cell wall biosynthesis
MSRAQAVFRKDAAERAACLTEDKVVARTEHDVAILLPAYNEEPTIAGTIAGFRSAMPSARIYVIDNNSGDGTAAIAEEILAQTGEGALLHEPRQGKGNAIRRGLLEIDADIFVMADADMTYPPEQIHELVAPIAEGRADMVIGDRFSLGDYSRENTRRFHEFGNNLIKTLVNTFFKAHITDIMTGYRAFNRTFARVYPIVVEGFELETDMTIFALRNRFRILEIPIRYRNRPVGSFSKLNTISDGLLVLSTVFNFIRHDKPFAFFSTIALCAACLGLLAGLPVLLEFAKTGIVSHVPLAILAAALEMVAITTFGTGLILDAVAHQCNIDHERTMRVHCPPRYSRTGAVFDR